MMFAFAYPKRNAPPPLSFLLYVGTGCGPGPGGQPRPGLVVPHFLIRGGPPASSHHAREGKQSWHVSLMRSWPLSAGKKLLFHHAFKFSSFNPRGGSHSSATIPIHDLALRGEPLKAPGQPSCFWRCFRDRKSTRLNSSHL